MAISNWQLAALVPYDNTFSGLVATNVQAAIDELAIDSGNFIRKNGNSFGEAFSIGSNDNFAVSLEANDTTYVTIDPSGNKVVVGNLPSTLATAYFGTDSIPGVWPFAGTETVTFNSFDIGEKAVSESGTLSAGSHYIYFSGSRLFESVYAMMNFVHSPVGVTGGSVDSVIAIYNRILLEAGVFDGSTVNGMINNATPYVPVSSITGIQNYLTPVDTTGSINTVMGMYNYVATAVDTVTDDSASSRAAYGLYLAGAKAYGSSVSNSAYGIYIDNNIDQRGTGDSFAIYSVATEPSYFAGSIYDGATSVSATFQSMNFGSSDTLAVSIYGEKAVDGGGTTDAKCIIGALLDATITDGSYHESYAAAVHSVHISDTNTGGVAILYVNANSYLDESTYISGDSYPGVYANYSSVQTRNLMREASGMYAYLFPITTGTNNAIMLAKGIQLYVISAYDFVTPWNADFDHVAQGIYADRIRSGGSLLNNKAYLLSVNTNSVKASGANSEAVGIKIQETGVTASGGTNTEAYGIKIDSGAITASGGSGTNTQYAIRVDDSSENYFEGLSTFKSGVKVKDTGAGSTTLSHYQEVAESDLGTLTWTAGVAPSGTITQKYRATRIGNRVDLWCRIEASVAGTAVTAVSFPLPSDTGISTPVAFTGMGNGEQNIVGSGAITVGGTVSTTGPDCSYLGKTGGGVWTVTIVGPSLAADTAYCHLTYFV